MPRRPGLATGTTRFGGSLGTIVMIASSDETGIDAAQLTAKAVPQTLQWHPLTPAAATVLESLERVKGIEPSYSAWKGFGG